MLGSEYELEFDKVVKKIREKNAKRVLLQLPDGLKNKAKQIQERLQTETGVQILIWAGSNYGACDIPQSINKLGVDLLVHYGHSEFRY